ncbi:hypothetical protein J1614_010473 [Plenodomus biglobosus]|nr:hypothetical protein J1614_010473 [Plenodomus biglobosus]
MLLNLTVPSRGLFLSIFIVSGLLFFLSRGDYSPRISDSLYAPAWAQSGTSKPTRNYAYTTFLVPSWDIGENATDDDDHYFTQTRMLLYQLKHDSNTRSPNNHPFVVLVTEDVPQSKRERLIKEGAVVKQLEKLRPLQAQTRKAWRDVLTKLRLLEMVEYDLVCFLDSDHILTRPLDEIFEDPAVSVQYNRKLDTPGAVQPDEGPQPASYVFASNAGAGGFDHELPPRKGNNLNAGIVVFRPDIELFNYHLSLTTPEAETRYNGRYPEQGLWGYAHRRNGNMPWTQLHWKWNINWSVYADAQAGIASLHVKYWDVGPDTSLRDLCMSIKHKMEGYWEAKAAL